MSERSQTITNRIVLMSDGGIESLVAASLILVKAIDSDASELARATLGCTVHDHQNPRTLAGSRLQCIKAQAGLIASKSIEVMPPESSLLSTLARAIEMAGQSGLVYWPIRCGDDAVSLQRTMDTMLGVVRIHSQITGFTGPELILPLLDLNLEQVAELACELDAPVQSGWPCAASTAEPCHQCESCKSWMTALNATGLPVSNAVNSA